MLVSATARDTVQTHVDLDTGASVIAWKQGLRLSMIPLDRGRGVRYAAVPGWSD